MTFCNTLLFPHPLKTSCECSLQRAQHPCSSFDSMEHFTGEMRTQATTQGKERVRL